MKKLYLHMGFHKTATTSFQETCKKNVDKLREQGFYYPLFNSPQLKNKNFSNHGLPLLSLYSEAPEKNNFNIVKEIKDVEALHSDYRRTLQKCLEIEGNIIISGEDIPFISEDGLQKLKQLFKQYSFEIVPFIVVRSPYEFMCSWIQQKIKNGKNTNIHFDSRLSHIVKVKKVFPNTQIFAFKETCKNAQGPTGFLFEQIGVNYKDFEFVCSNESASNTTVRLQNLLNQREPRRLGDKLNPNFISIVPLDSKKFTQKYLLTKEEYAEIKDLCDEENSTFRALLGEEFTDKAINFAPNIPLEQLHADFITNLEKTFTIKITDKHHVVTALSSYTISNRIKFRYSFYCFLVSVTFGKTKKQFKQKKHDLKHFMRLVALLSRNTL